MSSAPNIEMIASSLRSCSLNGGFRRRVQHQDRGDGITVELNSEVALPYRWQQCLDIRTGQVYYVNWEDGTRTIVDPRTSSHFSTLTTTPRSVSTSSSGSGYTSASSVGTVAAAEWFSSTTGGYGYDESDGYNYGDEEDGSSSSSTSSRSSAISSFSPTDESASSSSSENGNTAAGHVLVTAGCRGCFMYFMVPKSAGMCPKCGSFGLLHLSRSNYA